MPRYLVTYADGATRLVDAPDEAAASAHATKKDVLASTRPVAPEPAHGAVVSVTPAP